MKKISKEQEQNRDELLAEYAEATAHLAEIAEKLEGMIDDYNNAARAINDIVDQMQTVADDIAGEIREYIEERSEKWQESDTGEAYAAWLDQWDSLCLEGADELHVYPDESSDVSDFEQAATSPDL